MNNLNSEIENIRHSLAHLLGAAVLKLYPKAKLAIGPAIENGFYYDFDIDNKISDTDLVLIEKEMREIIKDWEIFHPIEVSADEAKKIFKTNPYKLEIINELEKNKEKITIFYSGPKNKIPNKEYLITGNQLPVNSFIDLCRGGHVKNITDINPDAFKLSHIAGAYWRGDEKKPQLTRIYGLAFKVKEELETQIKILDEAKKRDHKKLGPELDLFTFSELVGSGLPLFTPKGTIIRDLLDNFVWELRSKYDYQRVDIPHITKKELYEKSGHWEKFENELFKITTREGHFFALKPMNCPHHTQIYARKPHSYKELPQRYANTTKVYRDEQSGELAGLSRVRSITQDDAHVFCRINQVKEEIQKIWNIVCTFYESLGLKLDLRLSLRDTNNPENYLGNKEHWDKAEKILREVAKENKTPYKESLGEAAFYAPKLDFMATDSLGRKWQVATIQLDVHMPERFDLYCINEKGEKERIVMIHAAIMGSVERLMSILIEHFGGSFPVWLAPIQVSILPISDNQNKWADKIGEELKKAEIRYEINKNNETLGKKIREAELQKIPYLVIIGEKESRKKVLSIRKRGKGDIGQMKIEKFIDKIKKETNKKTL
jgi:threonyl-tRNA synthetase